MESSNDQQTPPTIPNNNNSSSRRKQSKPNRLEHAVLDNLTTIPSDSSSTLTPYHAAAEQNLEDEYDQVSLNCEDGSLSSQSNEENLHNQLPPPPTATTGVLDFSLKLTDTNQSSNRTRSLNTSNKSRSLKRKHPSNGNIDHETNSSTISNRIFHADAFCNICRKEFCNKYFLKTHLANKHGIFDQQSLNKDASNHSHSFTVISSLRTNEQDEISSPSSDIVNHQIDENENELSSLQQQMNGVIPGDDDEDDSNNRLQRNFNHEEQEDEDEQDGSTTLLNLPQQIASILANDNSIIKTDDDQRVMTTNSPSNNLEYSSRQSTNKLLEDFCEICQKHFCNKYYLRKHKLDVHGVQTDCNIKPYKRIDSAKTTSPTTTTTIQLASSFPNVAFNPSSVQQSLGILLNPIFSPLVQSTNSSNDQNNLSTTTTTSKRRYTDSSNESSSSKSLFLSSDVANVFSNSLVSTTNSKSQISTCHLCGKKFQSNDYLQLHLMNKHQIKNDLQRSTSKLTNIISKSSTNETPPIKKIKLETNETTIESNPTTIVSGIVDTYFAAKMADRVSCDICHKQVCNKYFLKTHKLKVHGVGSSDSGIISTNVIKKINEEENDIQQSNDSNSPRLVVDDMIHEPGAIPSPDALTASVNTFLAGGNNESNEQFSSITCELCSKTFPSKFLLHIHMSNVHGISQPSSTSNGTTPPPPPLLLPTSPTTTNSKPSTMKRTIANGNNPVRLKQTPQVQLRVTCQVCKKELCNKYFLRAHMRNVHNISVDDIRLIQPTSPNSDKQQQQQFSSSTNLLSPIDHMNSSSQKSLLSNENDSNHFNGHTNDSNESENVLSSNDNNNNHNQLLSMQPFLVESDDDLYKDLFVPCMVYLPCRHRVTKPLEVSLRLKPVDNTSMNNNND